MEPAYNKLLNSLIEICVVVGVDQDTGLKLKPLPSEATPFVETSEVSSRDPPLFKTMFETNVLAALSGHTASFPYAPPGVDGQPFYSRSGVFGSPAKAALRNRRRGSIIVKDVELPLAQDVICSLPPLCFPDGSFVSKKKKPVVCHSLVLTDIEGNRTYCSCMTFYRAFLVQEVFQEEHDDPGNYQLIYMDENNDETELLNDSSVTVCYVPTCCCLISKWPYFNLLKDCLSSLLPQLTEGDSQHFKMALMQFVSQLAMVPVPPPGSLGIEFELCGVKHVVRPAENPETRVVNMDLRYPFLYFSLDNILLLMGYTLTQQRIVFLSSSFSLLTPVIESLFTYIQPFSWSWTYVPVLPSDLLDLVEAPGAFIMGCHSKHKDKVVQVAQGMDELSSLVIADIDEGTVRVYPNQDTEIPGLPDNVTGLFKFRMKNAQIHFDRLLIERQSFYSLEEIQREREKFVKDFQMLVLASAVEMMLRMFSDMKNHIWQQEDLFFDMETFIDLKPADSQEFYREVCKSHAFSMFLYIMHDPEKTDFFTLMAQKTGINPKPGPMRKRSSSSTFVPKIPQDYFVFQQEELSILTLPSFTLEGLYTGSFYTKCLSTLDENITSLMKKSSSLLANYLYLRGMFWIGCGENVKAVDDFFGVSSRNVQLFPTKTVREIMCKLDSSEVAELRSRHFWRKAEHLMLQTKAKDGFRHERKEVVTSAKPSSALDLEEFVKHVSMLQIANSHEAGKLLFEALTTNSRAQVVEPETFCSFYEAFNQACLEAESVSLRDGSLGKNEYVLKISRLIRTDLGMGWLVLTDDRLLFLPNGTKECSTVFSISDINSVDTYSSGVLSLGVPAIKITSKFKKEPFIVFLKEERDFWRKCLLEIQAGHQIGEETKDPLVINQAAQNVIMADALRKGDYSEQTASNLLYFSKRPRSASQQLSKDTGKALLKRISPSPQDVEKTTVEALLYVPGSRLLSEPESNPKVWCAMGSGLVVVIDATTWLYETQMKHAKDRVSCLIAVGEHQLWAGSLDSTIYVINTQTRKADQQLLGHQDCITHMIKTKDHEGHTTVWSASLNGQIVGWDPETLNDKKQLQLKLQHKDEKTMFSFTAVGQHFWCATRFSIHVINYETECELKVLKVDDEKGNPMSIDCMCAVSSNQVWTACARKGLIVIWDTKTYENKQVTFGEDGFTNMILVGGKVWAGSRSGTVFVMDASGSPKEEKKLELHKDRVRSMCVTDHGLVLTGPGSRDGQIAVWKSHLTAEEPEAEVDSSNNEDCNGFVCVSNNVVQFNLNRNQTYDRSRKRK